MAEIRVRFDPAPGPLDNPLKGWCVYTDGPIYQPYSMVFRYVSWRELEPREGEYRFAEWEQKTWEVPQARGKHIVLRVYVDYPAMASGLPDWIREKGVAETPYTDHGGGKSPDYNHPAMATGLERLIAALGQRYDTHPRIAFLQLGLLGFWGEWHTWPRENLFASEAIRKRVVDAYRHAFPHKNLMARYAREYPGQQAWLGFHDDYFPEDTGDEGPEKDWHFLHNLRKSGRDTNWKRSVIGGEMIPHEGKNALYWLGNAERFAFTLKRAEETHFSWIGPYSPALEKPPSPEFTARAERLVQRMGYEYRLTELRCPETVSHGKPFVFTLTGENQGVAPFYYPWAVHLALLNDANQVVEQRALDGADIRTWLPGPFTLRKPTLFRTAAPGRYRLAVGIVDPWSKKPTPGFANRLPRVKGWNVLTSLTLSR
jgi:hypothetical protein